MNRNAFPERLEAKRRGHAEIRVASDPTAHWTGANGGHAFFAYTTNYPDDVDNAIIVDDPSLASSW